MGEAGGAAATQLTLLQQEAGYRVRDHFSGALAFAPIPSSSRSVVARSAAMPFWSCSIDLTPFADLGSLSMFRSFLFRRQSEIAFQSMVPHIEFGAMCRDTRLFGVLLLNFGNEALVSVVANGTPQRHAIAGVADLHQHLGRLDAARSARGGAHSANRADRADGRM
jgi:hypothetical protein